jgi:hypothetical protein
MSTSFRKNKGVVGKRKAAPVNLGEESLLISGVVNDVVGYATKDRGEEMEPPAKKVRVAPPENDVVVKGIISRHPGKASDFIPLGGEGRRRAVQKEWRERRRKASVHCMSSYD